MGTNFWGFPHSMGFAVFSHTMGNWWESPCISHIMKYTIGWKLNMKKVPILWEKYEYQFLSFSSCNEFCCIFPCYEKLMGKPKHFPYDEVYHRIRIEWEKSTHTMRIVWVPISLILPIQWGLSHLPIIWEVDGKTHAFPIWWDSFIFFCASTFALWILRSF